MHETINFVGHGVNGQGHMRPKIDLEPWRRHIDPLASSGFSSSNACCAYPI